MGISYKPSNSELPNPVTASGDMLVSGNLVVDGILTAGGISGSGEANTASNVGGGAGVFKGKTGVDLQFKSLVGSGVTINSTTNTIELTASGGGSTNPGGSNTQVQFNQNGSFAGDSGFTYDGSGSAFVSSSFTASSLQLYNEATSSQTVDFSVLSNGSTVLKRSGSNPEIIFNRSDGDQVSFMQFQANAGTATGFVDSVSKGLSVGLNGKDGYMLARDTGSKLYIGTNGVADAIVIDSDRNATFAKNLSTNGNTTIGDSASDFHQVSGTLSISGSQPLKVFGPQGGVGGASIIARHTSSIDDWETPISGALVVSADVWGEQGFGAVMYVHSQDDAAIIGFKNSTTLGGSPSGIQKNAVTNDDARGAYAGLVGSNIVIRNEIPNGKIQLHTGTTEFTVDDPGVIIGNSVSDVHQVTGTLTVSGNVSASNIVPHDDLTYDLGSTTLQWNNIYANELIGDVDGAVRFDAINSEGAAISKGQVVYINGVSGQTPTVGLAACDDASKMPAFGLAAADAANSASVQIVTFGSLSNLNLTTLYGKSFTAGDIVFVETGSNGTSGSLTNVAPTGSNNLLQNLGKIVRNGTGSDGQIKVGGAGRSNATPNLDEGYIFVGNGSDQSVQDNTIYVSSSANLVGINTTNPNHTLTISGNLSASTSISASAFYGDGSNLQNLPAGSPGGLNTQIQFNQNGSFAGNNKLTYNGTGSLFVSASVTSSVITGDQDISASNVELLINVTNQNAFGNENYSGSIVLTLPNDETGGSKVDIRKYGSGSVAYISADGDVVGNGNAQFSNGQVNAGNGFFGPSLDNESGDVTIRPSEGNKTLLKNISGSGGVRFEDKDDATIGQITSGSTGGIDFDYYTGSISNVALIQNTYYSASISSDTSVPTNQYNFINYQLGASLALTASSPVAGASYIILLRQDGTGGRVVSFDSATFKFPSGSSTTNSTGSNEVDIVTGISDGSVIYAAMSKKFQ